MGFNSGFKGLICLPIPRKYGFLNIGIFTGSWRFVMIQRKMFEER